MASIGQTVAKIRALFRHSYVNDSTLNTKDELAATLRWFTAGGAIRIALRQLSQTWKLHHYDVIDDVITRKL